MLEKIQKKVCKNTYLETILYLKIAYRVCFESPSTRVISNLKYKSPHFQKSRVTNQTVLWR